VPSADHATGSRPLSRNGTFVVVMRRTVAVATSSSQMSCFHASPLRVGLRSFTCAIPGAPQTGSIERWSVVIRVGVPPATGTVNRSERGGYVSRSAREYTSVVLSGEKLKPEN
jgi:hypothetical protein